MKENYTKLFRPSNYSKKWLLKEKRNKSIYGRGGLNFHVRTGYTPVMWTKHQIQFARRFSILHYLACHSPKPIQKKYKNVYNDFMNRHFAQKGRASVRFLNKHTCHSWL